MVVVVDVDVDVFVVVVVVVVVLGGSLVCFDVGFGVDFVVVVVLVSVGVVYVTEGGADTLVVWPLLTFDGVVGWLCPGLAAIR